MDEVRLELEDVTETKYLYWHCFVVWSNGRRGFLWRILAKGHFKNMNCAMVNRT